VKRGGVTGIYRDYIMVNNKESNEMRLLKSFIKASGFNIKEEVNKYMFYHPNEVVNGEAVSGASPHMVFRTDYKVTKKPNPLTKLYDGVALKWLTQNIIDIECNPTLGNNQKWIKYPAASFLAVVDWFGDDAIKVSEGKYLIHNVEVSIDE
jgi:hypothetical protein